MKRSLGYLWASPASLIGALLSVFFDRRYVTRGVIVAEGARWPRRLGWRYKAITFGHVVLTTEEPGHELLDHELVHVAQYERWGPLYFIAYPLASLRALLRGGHYYRDNSFEVEARRGSRD